MSPEPLDRAGRVGVARDFLRTGVQGALLLLSAGRLDWWNAWLYLALVGGFQTSLTLLLLRRDPALLNARGALPADAERWDLPLVVAAFLLGYAGLVVAGLDAGRGAPAGLPVWTVLIGAAGLLAGSLLVGWAMLENPHFEALVRIQGDDHAVCSSGPYAIVRHPGYLGVVIATLATPLLLGSAWALIPASASAALFVVRTALEDRTLRRRLPGYPEYAGATPWRLVPGLW